MEPIIDPIEGFGLENLPWGVFTSNADPTARPRIGTALGDSVVDVGVFATAGLFPGPLLGGRRSEGGAMSGRSHASHCMDASSLNALMALVRRKTIKIILNLVAQLCTSGLLIGPRGLG